jgi:hypothetical protein
VKVAASPEASLPHHAFLDVGAALGGQLFTATEREPTEVPIGETPNHEGIVRALRQICEPLDFLVPQSVIPIASGDFVERRGDLLGRQIDDVVDCLIATILVVDLQQDDYEAFGRLEVEFGH